MRETILKEQLINTLASYPVLNQFFRDMLDSRVGSNGWLQIPLVQMLLRNSGNLQTYTTLISEIEQIQPGLSQTICKLSGKDQEFDSKIHDIWAEIKGAHWLIRNGATNLVKIPESSSPTPDFECRLNSIPTLAEVKNMRPTDEIFSKTVSMLEEQALLKPDSIGKLSFTISTTGDAFPNNEALAKDEREITSLATSIIEALKAGATEASRSYQLETGGKIVNRSVSLKWSDSSGFRWGGHSDSFRRSQDSAQFTVGKLGLIRKSWRLIIAATEQLQNYDSIGSKQKFVLLNWMKPMSLGPDDDFTNWYRSFLEKCNQLLTETAAQFTVRLIERELL